MSVTIGPIYNNQNGKTRSWEIVLSMFDKDHKHVPITSLDMDVVENNTVEYVSINGLLGMKMTTSSPTVITVGKNLGKKNATNQLTQAYSDAMSKYRAKLKAGYKEIMVDLEEKQDDTQSATTKVPFPMALKTWKDFGDRLKFPLFVQPKLDGHRMIAMLDSNGTVILRSRRLHDVPGFDKLKAELQSLYDRSDDQTIILDGELYKHGMGLQHISGIVRAETGKEKEKDTLKYYLFDSFSIGDKRPFDARMERLRAFVGNIKKTSQLIINDTKRVESEMEADEYYDSVCEEGYEGIIYKSLGKPYDYSLSKEKRSMWYLKRKQQFDAEFEIVDFTQGKGKDHGCVVFILKTKEGLTFNSVINGTYDYRKVLYQQCLEDFTPFKGKMAKVQFEDYSADGVPLRNRMIMIRDMDFD
jgi:ATP-dependent DNA ligase